LTYSQYFFVLYPHNELFILNKLSL